MHFCKARIAIGGDSGNVLIADEQQPISWPEVLILQQVHGNDAITNVEPFVAVDSTPREERDRLTLKYGDQVVTHVFGGKQGPAEMEAPRVKLKTNIQWNNPVSGLAETTGNGAVPEETPFDEPALAVDDPDYSAAKRKK